MEEKKPKLEGKDPAPEPSEPAAPAIDEAKASPEGAGETKKSAEQPPPADVQAQVEDQKASVLDPSVANIIKDKDRALVEAFFSKQRPDGVDDKVKVKVHKSVETDASSGAQVEETVYLNLDFTEWKWTKSKKVKRRER